MGKSKENHGLTPPPKRPPATTPERRELELIAKAYDLAERRLDEGTISAQENMHFLKLGTERERLERAKLEGEIELQKARITQIESAAKMEELFAKAISAMVSYQGGDAGDINEIGDELSED